MGVASECCCKEVYYRYPHNNYLLFPTPLVLALFLAASSLFLRSFLNVFSFFIIIIIESVDSINRDERGFPLT